jgi:CheY-like chemotaxis protein
MLGARFQRGAGTPSVLGATVLRSRTDGAQPLARRTRTAMSVTTRPHLTRPTRPRASSSPLGAPLPVLRCAAGGDEKPTRKRGESERQPKRRGRAAGHPRVLVADDESAIRLLCRVNLSLAGMEVLEAANGATAIEIARRELPDIILLDVMMPEVDGWEVVAELARDVATRDIPIVFLTARSERVDQRRGLEAGAVAYVTKPFDPVRLGSFLQELLDRIERGERDELRNERLREVGDD